MQTITHFSEAVELIKNIDNYISQHEAEQLNDLKRMSDMSRDICGLDKTVTIYSDNISLFQSFFKLKSDIHLLADKMKAEEAKRSAEEVVRRSEEAREAEEARRVEEAMRAEDARRAEEARIAEQGRLADEARVNEQARLAERARLTEQSRLAEQARLADEAIRKNEIEQLQNRLRIDETETVSEIKCVTPSPTPFAERKSVTPSPVFLDAKSVTPSPLIFAEKTTENQSTSAGNGNYTYSTSETRTEISTEIITKTYAPGSPGLPVLSETISMSTEPPPKQPSPIPSENVLLEPSFVRLLKNGTVKEDQSFELECQVAGNPMPTVQWFRNDVCIDNIDAYSFSYENGNPRMVIKSTKLDDQAIFMCKATNAKGTDQTKAYLSVQRKYIRF